ncbi:hypothetical protein HX109_10715 [Galbibacter sp. BG1]|uniref:hypothetical protein n=1 Tax=Galbibacter sp. BG1 TaxID=1170699 RepID=UPI0015BC57C6|nr:hypothetical protein [Galbibacter sp. BG1]QLE02002.1 hypothetical protein HX109_10715 [Galbibacter sp. BG1]
MDLDVDPDSYNFDDDFEMDRMDKFYLHLQNIVIDLFSKSRDKAAGNKRKHKEFISIHNSEKTFDLSRKRWIKC